MFKGKDTYPQRDCIALFPTLCSDYTGNQCTSYIHIGQHSGADPWHVMQITRPATKQEYRALAKELRGRGYRFVIYKRNQPQWREVRRKQATESRRRVQADPSGLPWSPQARSEAMQPV